MEEHYTFYGTLPSQSPEDLRKKQLRREANIQGGALLIYKALLTVCVVVIMFASCFAWAMEETAGHKTNDFDAMLERAIAASGWGYLLAVAIGLLILLFWKKPGYLRDTVAQKGRPMTFGVFAALVCLVFGCQLPAQLLTCGLDWLFGGSLMEVMEQNAVDTDSLPMWLYVCLAAPVAEELLFRGLLLRGLEPYSKSLAVVASAVLFGLFHGNPVQTPYAFAVGLLLGYVALRYHVVWAILLHVMNNFLLGDLLPRLLAPLPYAVADVLTWIILGIFFLAALLVLLVKWRHLARLLGEPKAERWQKKAFWGAPCIVIVCIWCAIDIAAFLLLLFL